MRYLLALIFLFLLYASCPFSFAGSIVGSGNEQWCGEVPDSNDIDFIAIAGGNRHSLALKSIGTILGWGQNEAAQNIPFGNDFIAIAAGAEHSFPFQKSRWA